MYSFYLNELKIASTCNVLHKTFYARWVVWGRRSKPQNPVLCRSSAVQQKSVWISGISLLSVNTVKYVCFMQRNSAMDLFPLQRSCFYPFSPLWSACRFCLYIASNRQFPCLSGSAAKWKKISMWWTGTFWGCLWLSGKSSESDWDDVPQEDSRRALYLLDRPGITPIDWGSNAFRQRLDTNAAGCSIT